MTESKDAVGVQVYLNGLRVDATSLELETTHCGAVLSLDGVNSDVEEGSVLNVGVKVGEAFYAGRGYVSMRIGERLSVAFPSVIKSHDGANWTMTQTLQAM
jgi:hypothetical protein